MDRHRTPRPTSDLTTAAAELSAKQREVFGALQQFPQGAQVTELAKELGMHINTVRGHLDELIAHGLVVRRQARTTGRGRPSHIFTARVARNADVTSEYVELVDMLATAIAGDDLERAREVGRQWAKEASSRHGGTPRDLDEATEKVARILRDMGVPADRLRMLRSFDPRSAAHPDDVEDPYYGTLVDFEDVFAVIETSLPGVHAWVDERLAERVTA